MGYLIQAIGISRSEAKGKTFPWSERHRTFFNNQEKQEWKVGYLEFQNHPLEYENGFGTSQLFDPYSID